MRKKRGAKYLWATLCASPLTMLTSLAMPAPHLVVDAPNYDFGIAHSGIELEHVFVLRNEGDAPLTINRVNSSCGCTVTKLSDTIIPPGDEQLLTAKISLKNRHGPQRMQITIQSDDPRAPVSRLSIEGRAIRDFEVRPSHLNFGTAAAGHPVRRTLDIISDEEIFHPVDISATSDALGLRVTEIKPGHHYRLIVELSRDAPLGLLDAEMRMRTDHPRHAEIVVPLRGKVTDQPVMVSPESLHLPETWQGPLTRQIVVRVMGETAFQIEEITLPHADISARIFPMGASGYRIQISNLRVDLLGVDASIRIKTDIPESQSMNIPIRRIQPETETPPTDRIARGGQHE